METKKKIAFIGIFLIIALGAFWFMRKDIITRGESSTIMLMDTTIIQRAYGENAKATMQEVQAQLKAFEDEQSIFISTSDIARINNSAGKEPVTISERTFNLLSRAKELSLSSNNTFALTIAPLTVAWGITSSQPRIVPQNERENLIALINDENLVLENNTAFLKDEGQAIDLGGIAKGTACDVAKDIYDQNGVASAMLNVGGSCIYVKGEKPDGSRVRVGFRDPLGDENASIASFTICDEVLSTSGGYERFYEEDGIKYHHILDPKTGAPAVSDIVSIGVLCEEGTLADFLSTALYIQGLDKAVEYLENGGKGIILAEDKKIYVSKSLQSSFKLIEETQGYEVIFI